MFTPRTALTGLFAGSLLLVGGCTSGTEDVTVTEAEFRKLSKAGQLQTLDNLVQRFYFCETFLGQPRSSCPEQWPLAHASFQSLFPYMLSRAETDGDYLAVYHQKSKIKNAHHMYDWLRPSEFLTQDQYAQLMAASEVMGLRSPGDFRYLHKVVDSYYYKSGDKPIKAMQYLYLMAEQGDTDAMDTLGDRLAKEGCQLEAYHWVLEANPTNDVSSTASQAVKFQAYENHTQWREAMRQSPRVDLACGVRFDKIQLLPADAPLLGSPVGD